MDVFVGNSARNSVLIVPFCGDRVWSCKSAKVGLWVGVWTLLGPRNITFSTFAMTDWRCNSKHSTGRYRYVIVIWGVNYLDGAGFQVVRHQQKSRAIVYAYPNTVNKATHKLIKRQQSSFPCTYHVPYPPPTSFHKHTTSSAAPSRAKSCSLLHHSESEPSCNSKVINMREVISVNGKFPRDAPLHRCSVRRSTSQSTNLY